MGDFSPAAVPDAYLHKSIRLAPGITLTLSATGNFLAMPSPYIKFAFGLVTQMVDFEQSLRTDTKTKGATDAKAEQAASE